MAWSVSNSDWFGHPNLAKLEVTALGLAEIDLDFGLHLRSPVAGCAAAQQISVLLGFGSQQSPCSRPRGGHLILLSP